MLIHHTGAIQGRGKMRSDVKELRRGGWWGRLRGARGGGCLVTRLYYLTPLKS